MADVARLKQELKTWERNFRDEHDGRAPTKEDTKKDPAIAAKYKLYRSLPKSSTSTMDSSYSAGGTSDAGPSKLERSRAVPLHSSDDLSHNPSLISLHKSQPIESPTKLSTSNPFSPSKRSTSRSDAIRRKERDITPDMNERNGSIISNRIDVNPFLVSPSKSLDLHTSSIFSAERPKRDASKARENYRSSSPSALPAGSMSSVTTRQTNRSSETNPTIPQKPYHFATSPRKLKSLLASNSSRMATGTTAGTASMTNQAPAFTPRTKARKRMRGEEVPFTPSEGRRNKRTRAASPVSRSESDLQSQSRAVSSEGDKEQILEDSDADVDEIPDSPVKPRYSSSTANGSEIVFRAIFNDHPNNTKPMAETSGFPSKHTTASSSELHSDPLRSSRTSLRHSTPFIAPQGGEEVDEVTQLEPEPNDLANDFVIHPPSPPPASKKPPALQAILTSGRKNPQQTQLKSSTYVEEDHDQDMSAFEDAELVIRKNVAWKGARILARERNSQGEDTDDDTLGRSDFRQRTPTPEPDTDLNLAGHLAERLAISGSEVVLDVIDEALGPPSPAQGHQDLSKAAAPGEIWDVGEIDDDVEDWESEPEGWNASPDL